MNGVVIGNEHQEQWANTQDKEQHTFQNPLTENLNHTKLLATLLNMPLDNLRAIVIFSDTCTLPEKVPKNVGYAKEMISYIQSIERSVFNQEMANEVIDSINSVKLSTSEMVTEISTPKAEASTTQSETTAYSCDDETLATATQESSPESARKSETQETATQATVTECSAVAMTEAVVEKSAQETASQEKAEQESKVDIEGTIAPVEEEATSAECNKPEQKVTQNPEQSCAKENVLKQSQSLEKTALSKVDQAEADLLKVSTAAKDELPQETNIDTAAPLKKKIKIGFAPPMEPRDKGRKPFTPPKASEIESSAESTDTSNIEENPKQADPKQ